MQFYTRFKITLHNESRFHLVLEFRYERRSSGIDALEPLTDRHLGMVELPAGSSNDSLPFYVAIDSKSAAVRFPVNVVGSILITEKSSDVMMRLSYNSTFQAKPAEGDSVEAPFPLTVYHGHAASEDFIVTLKQSMKGEYDLTIRERPNRFRFAFSCDAGCETDFVLVAANVGGGPGVQGPPRKIPNGLTVPWEIKYAEATRRVVYSAQYKSVKEPSIFVEVQWTFDARGAFVRALRKGQGPYCAHIVTDHGDAGQWMVKFLPKRPRIADVAPGADSSNTVDSKLVSDDLRKRIVKQAREEANDWGKAKTIAARRSILKTYFDKADYHNINGPAKAQETRVAIEKSIDNGMDRTETQIADPNDPSKVRIVQTGVPDWCGIFATAVLAKSGVDARWRWIPGGGGLVGASADAQSDKRAPLKITDRGKRHLVKPGDIIAVNKGKHHFIVTGIAASGANFALQSVDGNDGTRTTTSNVTQNKGTESRAEDAMYGDFMVAYCTVPAPACLRAASKFDGSHWLCPAETQTGWSCPPKYSVNDWRDDDDGC